MRLELRNDSLMLFNAFLFMQNREFWCSCRSNLMISPWIKAHRVRGVKVIGLGCSKHMTRPFSDRTQAI